MREGLIVMRWALERCDASNRGLSYSRSRSKKSPKYCGALEERGSEERLRT